MNGPEIRDKQPLGHDGYFTFLHLRQNVSSNSDHSYPGCYLILIGYRGYMSLKTSILRSYVGPLVCGLPPISPMMADGYVPLAQKPRLLKGTRFDVYLRQVAIKLAALCLLACASLTSADTLVVDESNHRGWTFFAQPAVTTP